LGSIPASIPRPIRTPGLLMRRREMVCVPPRPRRAASRAGT
jgi:hypothetical protein